MKYLINDDCGIVYRLENDTLQFTPLCIESGGHTSFADNDFADVEFSLLEDEEKDQAGRAKEILLKALQEELEAEE